MVRVADSLVDCVLDSYLSAFEGFDGYIRLGVKAKSLIVIIESDGGEAI